MQLGLRDQPLPRQAFPLKSTRIISEQSQPSLVDSTAIVVVFPLYKTNNTNSGGHSLVIEGVGEVLYSLCLHQRLSTLITH